MASAETDAFGTDRKDRPPSSTPKVNRFPRTLRRSARIVDILSRRQPDLTVVLENVHDPHNIAAVMRTCDAVGVMRIHLVYTIEKIPAKAFARRSSTSAAKWVDTRIHRSIESCYECLRASGFRVLATAGGNPSVSLFEVDFLAPVAIVFGNEMRGLSEEAIALADTTMTIPMAGMVRSLNISVACAVSLYEAFRQRYEHGCYDAPSLSENDIQRMTRDWEQR